MDTEKLREAATQVEACLKKDDLEQASKLIAILHQHRQAMAIEMWTASLWIEATKRNLTAKTIQWLEHQMPLKEACKYLKPNAKFFANLATFNTEIIETLSQDHQFVKNHGRLTLTGLIQVPLPASKSFKERVSLWDRLLFKDTDKEKSKLQEYRELYLVSLLQGAMTHDNLEAIKWLFNLKCFYKKTATEWLYNGLIALEWDEQKVTSEQIKNILEQVNWDTIEWGRLLELSDSPMTEIIQTIRSEREKNQLEQALPRQNQAIAQLTAKGHL